MQNQGTNVTGTVTDSNGVCSRSKRDVPKQIL